VARFRLSASAKTDIRHLLAWPLANFGDEISARYQALLIAGFRDIAGDPERLGSIARPELGSEVRSYHLRFSRHVVSGHRGLIRAPRHLLLYRVIEPDLTGISAPITKETQIPARGGDRCWGR